MSLTAGARLGHYEIISRIGAGGMGEVYQARDPRLNRVVAIKVLVDSLSDQPEARARFEREAKVIATLNHPHIATIYDVGRHEDTDFLVMELIEGETLAARLAHGAVPLPQALQWAIEIADALDQAHRRDVTHRDLKPGNIMLTRGGVKLLDFGLAKLRPQRAGADAETQTQVTVEGTILGTLPYMAPEQIEGRDADARTDLFAFGAVLYEMVAGRTAFEGASAMNLMSAILRDTPPPASTLQPAVPVGLDRLIATCLAKTPDDRWQSARDVGRELQWILKNAGADSAVAAAAGPRRAISASLAASIALVGALAAAAAVWMLKPVAPARPSPVARATIWLPPGDHIGDVRPAVTLSPDGSVLAYVGLHGNATQLYLRAIDSQEASPILGTEGATSPFFSPDGRSLGFFAQGKLKRVAVSGGAAQTLCDAANNMGGSWAADDVIYFVPLNISGLSKIPAAGGTPQAVTTLDRGKGEVSHRWPQVLPGGRAVIFTVWTGPGSGEIHLHLQMLATGERRVLLQGASTGRYVASGHLVYARADALMGVPFDLDRLEVRGVPVVLGERLLDDEGANYSVSDSGTLAYVPVSPRRFERRLVWVDATGRVEPLAAPVRPYADPAISPDGRQVALTVLSPVNAIWIYNFSRGSLTSLTSNATGSSQAAVWSPDGTRIAYRGTRTGFRSVFWKAADGSSEEERLTTGGNQETPTSWLFDGKRLVFSATALATGSDIWVLPLDTRKPQAFLNSPAAEGYSRLSPDGRWMAYSSSESGATEVYVRPFPGPGGRVQISTDGGNAPDWSRNGRELFYRRGDNMLAVAMATSSMLAPGSPRILFTGRYALSDAGGPGYAVAADGRFLMVQAVDSGQAPPEINVVFNWFDELKRRVVPSAK